MTRPPAEDEHGIEGVTLWRLPPGGANGGARIRVRIGGAWKPRDEQQAERIEAAWDRARAHNPRIFNGRLLSVVAVHTERGEITCRYDEYKRLIVAAELGLEVHQLGVTGVVVGRDASGDDHVLLGRRSDQTRAYGGMWEFAPSGGLDPRRGERGEMDEHDAIAMVIDEAKEEVDLEVDASWCRVVGAYRDEPGRHDNIVLRIDLPAAITPSRPPCVRDRWEYLDTAWLKITEFAPFDASAGESGIVPSTRALARQFGWVGSAAPG